MIFLFQTFEIASTDVISVFVSILCKEISCYDYQITLEGFINVFIAHLLAIYGDGIADDSICMYLYIT